MSLERRITEARLRLFAAQRKAGVGYIEIDDDLCDEIVDLLTDLEEEVKDAAQLQRSNTALKGTVTRYKNLLKKVSDESNSGSGRATGTA